MVDFPVGFIAEAGFVDWQTSPQNTSFLQHLAAQHPSPAIGINMRQWRANGAALAGVWNWLASVRMPLQNVSFQSFFKALIGLAGEVVTQSIAALKLSEERR